MPSLRSRIANFVLRNRHLRLGRIRQRPIDFNTPIYEFRERAEKYNARTFALPEGVEVIEEPALSLPAEWIVPDGVVADTMILYVHGGGYVAGSCNSHRKTVAKFADRCGVQALLYEHRLAPEHPFPAALEDSVSVYEWLLEDNWEPRKMVLVGESSGGGLALALLLALRERNIPMPAVAVAISPWTDLTCSGESYRTKGDVSLAPKGMWPVFSTYYVGDQSPEHPLVSPLFGDLRGLPPLFISAGEDDELIDDARRFAEKASASGVDVTFRSGEGQVHCYPLLAPLFPEATVALNEIRDFIREALPYG